MRPILLLLVAASSAWGETGPVRVAVFKGAGAGSSCKSLIAAFHSATGPRFEVVRITADEIRRRDLAGFDVLVHPGGSGSKQGKDLGEAGRVAVRGFVREGGGYLGVCAGAYLATNHYAWSLDLIDAKVVDRLHWARGKGTVTLELSPAGSALFKHTGRELAIHYGQGPLLARQEWDDPEVPDYESLAVYASEIAKKGAPRGVMVGTSAAVRCEYGAGRVFCFSPHPELTDGLHHLIPLAAGWLVEEEPAAATR